MLCTSNPISHILIQGGVGGRRGRSKEKGMKDVLEGLPNLWDEEQYKSEYDLSSFMNSLSAAK